MKTILLHFIIVYSFIESTENTLINYNLINKFLSLGRYATKGKYNPDVDLNTGQIIRRYGYPSESHFVTTEDGYLLTIDRIPGKLKSHPILLQHGLFCNSVHWVLNGPEQALAFQLADKGYDVWIGNFRGTFYTRAHVNISTSDPYFWDYSYHELGVYDLPAIISYITNYKQSDLTYVGHSMGTTSFYIMSSLRPDIASRIRLMFSLAPVSYMGNLLTPARIIVPITINVLWYLHNFGINKVFPLSGIISTVIRYLCDMSSITQEICYIVISTFVGFDKSQSNDTLLPVIFGHTPDSTSYGIINHFGQAMSTGRFRRYDRGPKKNLQLYNSTIPPDYDLSKILVPIALYYADNDWLTCPQDVLRLSKQLKCLVDLYKVPYKTFNHFDFLFAIQVPQLINNRILQTMQLYKDKVSC